MSKPNALYKEYVIRCIRELYYSFIVKTIYIYKRPDLFEPDQAYKMINTKDLKWFEIEEILEDISYQEFSNFRYLFYSAESNKIEITL